MHCADDARSEKQSRNERRYSKWRHASASEALRLNRGIVYRGIPVPLFPWFKYVTHLVSIDLQCF